MIYFIKWNTETNEISVEDNYERIRRDIDLKFLNPKKLRLFIVTTDSSTWDEIVKEEDGLRIIEGDIKIIEKIKNIYLKTKTKNKYTD